MTKIRRQLTLFVTKDNETIERIWAEFNPVQYQLIPAHITLCREDEIDLIDKVKENIKSVKLAQPLCIRFDTIKRVADGKGVLIPSKGKNEGFHQLRIRILKGITSQPRDHQPHITLMHSRNSTCTDEHFDQITRYALPAKLYFDSIYLIEQKDGGE